MYLDVSAQISSYITPINEEEIDRYHTQRDTYLEELITGNVTPKEPTAYTVTVHVKQG